jgi:biopolymer transport protein ExbD
MLLRRRRPPAHSPHINLTPLIDTVFLLLIFFMMTTTFNKESVLNIDLPEAKGEHTAEAQPPTRIIITQEGNYAINQPSQSLVSNHLEILKQALQKEVGDNPNPLILISADANAPHQSVMRAMEAARDLGYSRLSFEAQEPVAETSPVPPVAVPTVVPPSAPATPPANPAIKP